MPVARRPVALRRGLYLITRPEPERDAWLARIAQVLAAGAVLVQYRDKSDDGARRTDESRALLALCRTHGVPLIINDDVALAQAIGADGVHLGECDATLAQARAALGAQAIIGVSCYDDLERARAAAAAGADYLAFGSFFGSSTKPGARRAQPRLLADSAMLGLPRVAIGGITPDNAATLVAAGADQLAVIAALWDAPDPGAVARRFAALYASTSDTGSHR